VSQQEFLSIMTATFPPLKTAPNFRDVGGYAGLNGRLVRRGLLFRSEAVLNPTPADAQVLNDIGIDIVCDLRGSHERDQAPNVWWHSAGAEMIELDIMADIREAPEAWAALKADPSPQGGRTIMRTIYNALPAATAPHLGKICQRIAEGALPLLIHCTAGKDRTGFLCAVLQTLLGVTYEAVISDYLASAGRASDTVAGATRALILHNAGDVVSEGAIEAIIGVDRTYLETAFSEIDRAYGGFEAYLAEGAGLAPDLIAAVRSQMLQPPS
jgi:protein-tyrosine phosphatase